MRMSDDFETAFGEFLEHKAYDEAEEALFSMLREAFIAGWKAAGGTIVDTSRVIQFVRKEKRFTT